MAITHPDNPAQVVDGRCNALLWNCQGEIDGERCDYHYDNATATICPVCNTPRRRCLRYPLKGRDACSVHGGKTLMGIDSPAYKGVGVSKHLPTALLDTFFEALEDPNILSTTEDIALLQARVRELTDRLRTNQPPAQIWQQLGEQFQAFRRHEHTAKTGLTEGQRITGAKRMAETLTEMETLVIKGYFEGETWGEIIAITEQIRKLRETERRRIKEAEQLITPSQFNTLLVYMVNSIKTRVKDPDIRMAVLGDLQSLRFGR